MPSKRLLAVGLASAMLLSPSIVASQNSNSQHLDNSTAAGLILRRVEVRYTGSFDDSVCQSIYKKLMRRGLLPQVESRYDQAKVDSFKKALQEMWKERGIAVHVSSTLSQIPNTHAAKLDFVVYKQ